MNAIRSRRGSALLIVLGMLSFVVVSAIAFAAYMRSSRLPSSYLRRTAAARLLAKAAVAQAIEEIDSAIANNPYPDQRTGSAAPSAKRSKLLGKTDTQCRNYWWHNIFIGDDTWLSPDDTVSTLTLEGLAYIPPPLVNEARRFSRMSHAATWHNLGFDSGRYAFCAIDVSDCLDINSLVANGRRNSGRRRITLAHAFENAGHTSYDVQPSGWETFMSKFRAKLTDDEEASQPRFVQAKVPLVSLADWNLALNADGSSGVKSPFCEYVTGSGSAFYNVGSADSAAAGKIRSMHYVTDSYFPKRELESDECDLASPDGQPFDPGSFSETATLKQVLSMGAGESTGMQLLNSKVCRLDIVNLYDYLDGNSVPVSLAVPTTEQVPMVCAVKPTLTSAIELSNNGKPTVASSTQTQSVCTEVLEYRLESAKFLGLGAVEALVAFPFRRADASSGSFTYEGCLRLFLAPSDINLRLPESTGIRPSTDQEFAKDRVCENGVFKLKLTPDTSPSFSRIDSEESAVQKLRFAIPPNALSGAFSDPAFTVTVQYPVSMQGGVQVVDRTTPTYTAAHCNMPPLGSDGKPNASYVSDASFLEMVRNKSGASFSLHAAIYIRVKNGEGKTVDLVPACADDDQLNGINNSALGPIAATICGDSTPILRFSGSSTIKYDADGFDSLAGAQETFTPQGVMCPDPRFNHAPENWIEQAVTSAQDWLQYCGASDRDGDIFMFVSDQEYLQSVYELAFLPNLSELSRSGDTVQGNCRKPYRSTAGYPQSIGDCANGDLMWNTYRCYDTDVGDRHDFEDIGLVLNDSAFRVNPYVQSVDGLMPAFANTPYSWRVASTNEPEEVSAAECDSAKDFNSKYAFSAMNSKAQFAWEDLQKIAKNFRDKVRSSNGDWESGFDNLGWDQPEFCMPSGETLSGNTDELYGVDRKFLYGFWHDSFANRQQLFLVFVRAEPMMMGGGGVGQTPPSLGARAVALVWRDPRTPEPVGGSAIDTPHRTRILFYRQFD